MVVLTGDVDEYKERASATAGAFVAMKPTMEAIMDTSVVIYNDARLSPIEIAALQRGGGLVRTWGSRRGRSEGANFVALDV